MLLVVRLKVTDVKRVQEAFANRDWLRERYECTSARLLENLDEPGSLLVLMEFPSKEKALSYLVDTSFSADPALMADLSDQMVGCYEDLGAHGKPGDPLETPSS